MSATGRGAVRAEGDFYRTPSWATRNILAHLPSSGTAFDAGCGDGAILHELLVQQTFRELVGIELNPALAEKARGLDLVTASTTAARMIKNPNAPGFAGTHVVCEDFLLFDPAKHGFAHPSLVIGNPPFNMALEFIEKALDLAAPARGTVAMLLRINWLEGQARAGFHRRRPCDVYVMPKRPSFTGGGTDATGYMWAAWGPGCGNRWWILDDA